MSWIDLTNYFFKLQGTMIDLGNKLTVFQITVGGIAVTNIQTF